MSAHPVLAPNEAYRLWAADWDNHPSAIVAVEARCLAPWLADVRGKWVLDISCGTGRWLEYAARGRATVIGLDLCLEMLSRAAVKPGLGGRLALSDASHLPVPDGCADIALCTLSLGHMREAAAVLAEMGRAARAGGTVIVSDFHPEAFRLGWKRTFRSGGQTYEIENHYHSPDSVMAAAGRAGLVIEETAEPCFGEPERRIYLAAGKPELFEVVRGVPAVWMARWRKAAADEHR
jgi:malonyl-CoA O-methyltransferase